MIKLWNFMFIPIISYALQSAASQPFDDAGGQSATDASESMLDITKNYRFSAHNLTVGETNPSDSFVHVCLVSDNNGSLFKDPTWSMTIGKNSSCNERLIANISSRILYFDYDGWDDGGALIPMGDYSTVRDLQEDDRTYKCEPQISAYTPCVSRFFPKPIIYTSLMPLRFDSNRFLSIVVGSGAISELDKISLAFHRGRYIDDYQHADSIEKIDKFVSMYTNDDADSLIPKLKDKEAELRVKNYRDEYAAASTDESMQAFISKYDGVFDPDGVVEPAKRRLAGLQQREAAADKRRNHENMLGDIERRIADCKADMAAAQKAIEHEREVADVSGYEDKQVLYQAGQIVVNCRRYIPSLYEQYIKGGGKKNLSELR